MSVASATARPDDDSTMKAKPFSYRFLWDHLKNLSSKQLDEDVNIRVLCGETNVVTDLHFAYLNDKENLVLVANANPSVDLATGRTENGTHE